MDDLQAAWQRLDDLGGSMALGVTVAHKDFKEAARALALAVHGACCGGYLEYGFHECKTLPRILALGKGGESDE